MISKHEQKCFEYLRELPEDFKTTLKSIRLMNGTLKKIQEFQRKSCLYYDLNFTDAVTKLINMGLDKWEEEKAKKIIIAEIQQKRSSNDNETF